MAAMMSAGNLEFQAEPHPSRTPAAMFAGPASPYPDSPQMARAAELASLPRRPTSSFPLDCAEDCCCWTSPGEASTSRRADACR